MNSGVICYPKHFTVDAWDQKFTSAGDKTNDKNVVIYSNGMFKCESDVTTDLK